MNTINRRTAAQIVMLGTLGAIAKSRSSGAADGAASNSDHDKDQMLAPRADQIAMLVYPKMTALDLIGPQYLFSSLAGAKVHLVAKSLAPVTSDTGGHDYPNSQLCRLSGRSDCAFRTRGYKGNARCHDRL